MASQKDLQEIVPSGGNGDVEADSQIGTQWSAPLLFDKPSRGIQCCQRRRRQQEPDVSTTSRKSMHSMDCPYPMYVISIEKLLQMEGLEPHQNMLANGLVVKWDPSMNGRIIFISHEWMGYHHADPCGEQFRELRRLVERLCKGEVPRVESHYLQQLKFGQNMVLTAKEWMRALPHMYVWWDFCCIPQMGVRGTAADTADQAGSGTLTAAEQQTAQDLKNAVYSIPEYIERVILVLILAPTCMHLDRHEPCMFGT